MTLKKFATGSGKATKLMMMNACKERFNFHPKNDDHADAFWVFKYYCNKYRIV